MSIIIVPAQTPALLLGTTNVLALGVADDEEENLLKGISNITTQRMSVSEGVSSVLLTFAEPQNFTALGIASHTIHGATVSITVGTTDGNTDRPAADFTVAGAGEKATEQVIRDTQMITFVPDGEWLALRIDFENVPLGGSIGNLWAGTPTSVPGTLGAGLTPPNKGLEQYQVRSQQSQRGGFLGRAAINQGDRFRISLQQCPAGFIDAQWGDIHKYMAVNPVWLVWNTTTKGSESFCFTDGAVTPPVLQSPGYYNWQQGFIGVQ